MVFQRIKMEHKKKLKCELYNDSMQEEWRDIKGYEGLYQVSSLGRVRSVDRTIQQKRKNTTNKRNIKGKILKLWKAVDYLHVTLSNEGKIKAPFVHKLVADAFVDNPLNLPHVNHKDENKINNNCSNLEWCTQKYNRNYGTGEERRVKSFISSVESHKRSRRPVLQIDEMGNVVNRYFALNQVRNDGFSPSCVYQCCAGQRKTHKGYRWQYE
jgi:hypothetical protein